MDDGTEKAVGRAEKRLSGKCVYCGVDTDVNGKYQHKNECNITMARDIQMIQNELIPMASKLAAIPYPLNDSGYTHEIVDAIDSLKRFAEIVDRRSKRDIQRGGQGNPF